MTRPRVGFLGVGWIGRNRMEAMLATDAVAAVAVADPARRPPPRPPRLRQVR
jgi:predicted dehydrogenase